ncbi:MAG: hypothetical protein AAF558_06490 [Verrucomicrobiota bacterium]
MRTHRTILSFVGILSLLGFFSIYSACGSLESILDTPGTHTYTSDKRDGLNTFLVHIPKAYTATKFLPLVFFGHPNGGSASKEMNQWKQRAESFPFIAVTMDLHSSRHSKYLENDKSFLKDVVRRVTGELDHDANWVVYTAHSGGGYAGWHRIATDHDKIFTALCFRSANCYPPYLDLSRSRWRNRPIYVFWSDNDAPRTSEQNPQAIDYLKNELKAKRLKYEIIPNGGHASHPEKFIAWLQEVITSP